MDKLNISVPDQISEARDAEEEAAETATAAAEDAPAQRAAAIISRPALRDFTPL